MIFKSSTLLLRSWLNAYGCVKGLKVFHLSFVFMKNKFKHSFIYAIFFSISSMISPVPALAQVIKIDNPITKKELSNKYILSFCSKFSDVEFFTRKIGEYNLYYAKSNDLCTEAGCIVFIIKGNAKSKPNIIIQSTDIFSISDSFYSALGSGLNFVFFKKTGSKIQINVINNIFVVK